MQSREALRPLINARYIVHADVIRRAPVLHFLKFLRPVV